jgi:chromosome segregation ATPase
MVLDPLSALSLAGTIVQFVDFTSKLVSNGCHIYGSANDASAENLELEAITKDLSQLNIRLKQRDRLGGLTQDEQSLEDLSNQCTQIADNLTVRLEKLKVEKDAKHRRWKSFRQALKSVWNEKDLNELAARLSGFRDQLQFHILVSLK